MRFGHLGAAVMVIGLGGFFAWAQEAEKPDAPDAQPSERLKRLLDRFDDDGDGKLSDEERAAARRAFQGERREDAERGPRRGPRDEDRPGRRERRRGEDRPGFGARLNADQIFGWLDQDDDGKISKEELGERVRRLSQADADGDGEITREEVQAVLTRVREQVAGQFNPEQMFTRLDRNSDGKLDKEELGERGQWLLRSDSNEDGEVTKEEFLAGAARMREQAANLFNPEQMFARMDQNNDGKLQADELRGPFAARLKEIDTDEDGALSKEEFRAAAQRLRGAFGPGGPGRPGGPDGAEGRRGPGGPGMPTVDETFARLDKNEDGKLTKDEMPERAAEFLMRADADGDEAVTKDELRAHRAKQRPGRGEGRPDADVKPPRVDDDE